MERMGLPASPCPSLVLNPISCTPHAGSLGTLVLLYLGQVIAAAQLWALRPRTSPGKPREGKTHLASSHKQQHPQDCSSQPTKASCPSPGLPSCKHTSSQCWGAITFFPFPLPATSPQCWWIISVRVPLNNTFFCRPSPTPSPARPSSVEYGGSAPARTAAVTAAILLP